MSITLGALPLAVTAVAASIVVATQPPSTPKLDASPICVGASVRGQVVAGAGPFCLPYGGPTVCTKNNFGLDPTLVVETTVCVPSP